MEAEPFLLEILYDRADRDIKHGHASVCAIASSEEEAEAMARVALMSHSLIVKSVELVVRYTQLRNDNPQNSELDRQILEAAMRTQSRCGVALSEFDPSREPGRYELDNPDQGTVQ